MGDTMREFEIIVRHEISTDLCREMKILVKADTLANAILTVKQILKEDLELRNLGTSGFFSLH
jgi:hypothetical protein